MGPRARARGNEPRVRAFIPHHTASMGPRARARGNPVMVREVGVILRASMGPRARARGNEIETTVAVPYRMLQWGRERALAEMGWPGQGCALARGFNGAASARSRKFGHQGGIIRPPKASMGPRARARGNAADLNVMKSLAKASMGPRARARGNVIASV